MKTSQLTAIYILVICVILFGASSAAHGDSYLQGRTASFHAGFFSPNGVDLVGYTVEHELKHGFYGYYNFGFPSLVAAGISYYSDYNDNGPAVTVGVGVGSIFYSSLVYQLRIAEQKFIKLGVGYTTGIAYTGAYPSLSYEFRFK